MYLKFKRKSKCEHQDFAEQHCLSGPHWRGGGELWGEFGCLHQSASDLPTARYCLLKLSLQAVSRGSVRCDADMMPPGCLSLVPPVLSLPSQICCPSL